MAAVSKPARTTRQQLYEAETRRLFETAGPFTKEMLHEHLLGMPAFADVTVDAVESAIKRGVNVTHSLVRVNGRQGYVQPIESKTPSRHRET